MKAFHSCGVRAGIAGMHAGEKLRYPILIDNGEQASEQKVLWDDSMDKNMQIFTESGGAPGHDEQFRLIAFTNSCRRFS